jgi:hypothetical protein
MQHFTAVESGKCKNVSYDIEYFVQYLVIPVMFYRFENDEMMM